MNRKEKIPPFNYEFGGPLGTFSIILFSHLLVYYLWISLTFYQGSLIYPDSIANTPIFFKHMWSHIMEGALPTWYATTHYLMFILFLWILASTLPGVSVKGLPVPSENGKRHVYLCNAIASWYTVLLCTFLIHYFEWFDFADLKNHLGNFLTVTVIFADVASLLLYLIERLRKKAIRMSGNFIYDFFMGASLNPKIGRVDIKLFLDIRPSWVLLFILGLSAALRQYQEHGHITLPMATILLAQGLYANACMKGEECVPTTWDIFYEKCGWMFIFWNLVGVPFFYAFQPYYILINNPTYPTLYSIFLIVALLLCYYVWDTANSQKNRFRMQNNGTYLKRFTFPQLPWGTLEKPRYLATKSGSLLLTDGWYRYARKIHYTADVAMATIWGLSCGFSGVLPYLYPTFFLLMIIHRYFRDQRRCMEKYGDDWKKYCEIVPYTFIPYIY